MRVGSLVQVDLTMQGRQKLGQGSGKADFKQYFNSRIHGSETRSNDSLVASNEGGA